MLDLYMIRGLGLVAGRQSKTSAELPRFFPGLTRL
jgi:hypothetical protein